MIQELLTRMSRLLRTEAIELRSDFMYERGVTIA